MGRSCCSCEVSRLRFPGLDGGHGDGVHDVHHRAAARKVVAGAGQALEDGEARRAAEALGDLVADVAGLQVGKDEDVRASRNRAPLRLDRGDGGDERGVELEFAVEREAGREFMRARRGLPRNAAGDPNCRGTYEKTARRRSAC